MQKKTIQQLNLEDDFLFSKVMSDKEICRMLLEKNAEIFLNKKGTMNDVEAEMLEFLFYVENTTDAFAEQAASPLIKEIHQKVAAVKLSKEMETE